MADDGLSRTTTNTHDLMVKPSTWDACSYAGGQHCPCETVCAATRLLLGDDDEATQLDNLEAEVRANGLERVLDTGIAASPRLRDIAASEVDQGQPLIQNPFFKRKIAELEIDLTSLEYTELRSLASTAAGKGHDGARR